MSVGHWWICVFLHHDCGFVISQVLDTDVGRLCRQFSVGYLIIACSRCACTKKNSREVALDETHFRVKTASCRCTVNIRCVDKIRFSNLTSSRSRDQCDTAVAQTNEREKDNVNVEIVLKDCTKKQSKSGNLL